MVETPKDDTLFAVREDLEVPMIYRRPAFEITRTG